MKRGSLKLKLSIGFGKRFFYLFIFFEIKAKINFPSNLFKRNTGKRARINTDLATSLFPSLLKEKVNILKHYYYFLMGFLSLQKNIESRLQKNSFVPFAKHPLSRYKSQIYSSFENSTILVDDKYSNKSVKFSKTPLISD